MIAFREWFIENDTKIAARPVATKNLIYLDSSVYNRLYDNQDDMIIRSETDAINNIFRKVVEGGLILVFSDHLQNELSAKWMPGQEDQVNKIRRHAIFARHTREDEVRANRLVTLANFDPPDALHIAIAERMRVATLFTVDKKFLRKAHKLSASFPTLVNMLPRAERNRLTSMKFGPADYVTVKVVPVSAVSFGDLGAVG